MTRSLPVAASSLFSLFVVVAGCGGAVDSSSNQAAISAGSPNGGGSGSGSDGSVTTTGPTADGTIHTKLRGDYQVLTADETDLYVAGFAGIARIPKKGGEAIILTTEGDFKDGIAVDETYVYYTRLSAGVIVRMPKTGGAGEVLAKNQVRPWGIAVDADTVYWACEGNAVAGVTGTPPGGQIASVPKQTKNGAEPQVTILAPNEQTPVSVALDGDWVYFANGVWGGPNGSIKRVKKSGGSVEMIADNRATLGIPSLTVVDGWVAWSEESRNGWKAPTTGGEGQVLNMGPAATLTGDGHDFFVAAKSDRKLEISGFTSATVTRLGIKGTRTFGNDETWFVNAIVADAKRIYWLDYWWSYRDPGPYSGVHSVPR